MERVECVAEGGIQEGDVPEGFADALSEGRVHACRCKDERGEIVSCRVGTGRGDKVQTQKTISALTHARVADRNEVGR